MYKRKFLLVIVVLAVLTLSNSVLAEDYCFDDVECEYLGDSYICDFNTFTCVDDGSSDTSDTSTIDSTDTSDDSSSDTTSNTSVDTITSTENTTTDTITSTDTSTTDSEIDTSEIESRLSELESRIESIESTLETLDVEQISAMIEDINASLELINTNIQLISMEQYQTEQDLEESFNEALAGLAALEQELSSAQGELEDVSGTIEQQQSQAELIRTVSFIVIIVAVFAALIYYFLSHKKIREGKTIPNNVRKYLTEQIKKGKKLEDVKGKLIQMGWPEHEVKFAYEETARQNYEYFLRSQGKKVPKSVTGNLIPPENQKIVVITVITLFILAALILFISNSTGNAVYVDYMADSDYESLVKSTLENYLQANSFYEEIDYLQLCVQVEDDKQETVSYQILKTPYGNAVLQSDTLCEASADYDFAVKFLSWESFYGLTTDLSCTNIQLYHASGKFYVLPSEYVAEGFSSSGLDYDDYCDVLNLCMTDAELSAGGLSC
ncbi:hypothetical protein HN918_03410 [archaeon]|jgi:hypothetical protein|nr:hypothetical protein [archaeon]MBT7193016.1 hypothetical protein [archaeon]